MRRFLPGPDVLVLVLLDLVVLALALVLLAPHPAPDAAGLHYFAQCAPGMVPWHDGLAQGWACHN